MVVGITGGIGSGKSLVVNEFLKFKNTVYYHADVEAKKLMSSSQEIRENIISSFGINSYNNNELNREYISEIVFKDVAKLQKLNSIVHPVVRNHFLEFISSQEKDTIILYENAILFEIGSDLLCDFVISVCAPFKERIKRVVERDQTTKEEVIQRMKNQWNDAKKKMLSNYLIWNVDKMQTMLKVQEIYNFLTKKA